MIGGIIGDLAASTYLSDKEDFYARLVGRDATVSEYSIAAFLLSVQLRQESCLLSMTFAEPQIFLVLKALLNFWESKNSHTIPIAWAFG